MSRKTVYYHDPLHDDFAPTNGRIHLKQINADFPYEHKGPLWNALAFIVYRLIMTPFLVVWRGHCAAGCVSCAGRYSMCA